MQNKNADPKFLRVPIGKHFCLIDEQDALLMVRKGWAVITTGPTRYVVNVYRPRIYLHRLILKPAAGLVVDHINGNGLDNRRCNLRAVTHGENIRNSKKSRARQKKFARDTQGKR